MDPDLVQVLELAFALFAAVVAWWQHRGKAGAERRSSEIISFYDPATAGDAIPVPTGVPDRSWQMPAATRVFLVRGLPREEQDVLLGQVDRAEREGRVRYAVSSPSAWYEIEYGLVKAGGRRDDLLLPGREKREISLSSWITGYRSDHEQYYLIKRIPGPFGVFLKSSYYLPLCRFEPPQILDLSSKTNKNSFPRFSMAT